MKEMSDAFFHVIISTRKTHSCLEFKQCTLTYYSTTSSRQIWMIHPSLQQRPVKEHIVMIHKDDDVNSPYSDKKKSTV